MPCSIKEFNERWEVCEKAICRLALGCGSALLPVGCRPSFFSCFPPSPFLHADIVRSLLQVDKYLSATGYLPPNVKPFFVALPKASMAGRVPTPA